MVELYWGFLAGGVMFAVAAGLFGDILSEWLDGMFDFMSVSFMKPVVIAGAVAGFGGAGILLDQYTPWPSALVLIASIVIALLLAAAAYFGYVLPMQNSENSVSFSMQDLSGKLAEVTIPIPADGYGEVMLQIGATHTNQIAASLENDAIEAGARVVVVHVKEGTLYVSRMEPTNE